MGYGFRVEGLGFRVPGLVFHGRSMAGSYLRLIDFVSLNSRPESNKEEYGSIWLLEIALSAGDMDLSS